MRVALVHELLTIPGGAERVLRVLADLFPAAPIYTLLYDERRLGSWFPPERVRPSRLHRFAPLSSNHHLYLRAFPAAVESWDFREFDLVLSSSSAFAHGIITNGAPKHLCYVHSPARYLWDRTHEVLARSTSGIRRPLRPLLSRTFHELRVWDAEAAARPDRLLAASKEVQRRIELYWRREADVLHPPISDSWFDAQVSSLKSQSYFLIVSTLADYKRIDLAIRAANALGLPLKIVGDGRARRSLERIAGPSVEFLGYRDHQALQGLYAQAEAVIVPGEEDFGLVPIESMACGTPVISRRAGGPLETVIEHETGRFFDESSVEALVEILQTFKRTAFDPAACRKRAERFREGAFRKQIREAVQSVMEQG